MSAQAAGEYLAQLAEVVQPLGSPAERRNIGDFRVVQRALLVFGLQPLTGRDLPPVGQRAGACRGRGLLPTITCSFKTYDPFSCPMFGTGGTVHVTCPR